MRSGSLFTVLLLFLTVAFSCSDPKEEPAAVAPETLFFPLKTKTFITYDVDSTNITQNVPTGYHFQLRISVVDSFKNAEGNITYLMQREKRDDETQPWKAAGTWSAYRSQLQAVVTEGNTSYVKLQFPLSAGKGWNGNALNNLGGDDLCNNNTECDYYEVTEMGDEVIMITQEDREDLVMTDQRTEKYTKHVGLTSKETTTFNYCTGGGCSSTQGFVLDGLKYKQEMIDSGTL